MLAGLIAGAVPGMPAGLIAGALASAGERRLGAGRLVVPVGAPIAGEPLAGGGGEVWPKEFKANVSEQRETVSSVFIGLGKGS